MFGIMIIIIIINIIVFIFNHFQTVLNYGFYTILQQCNVMTPSVKDDHGYTEEIHSGSHV